MENARTLLARLPVSVERLMGAGESELLVESELAELSIWLANCHEQGPGGAFIAGLVLGMSKSPEVEPLRGQANRELQRQSPAVALCLEEARNIDYSRSDSA